MSSNGPSSSDNGTDRDPPGHRDGSTPRLHGRRQGRPLRKGRARLIDTLLPQVALTIPPEGPLDLTRLFGGDKDSYGLEIGFGAGEHLAWQAAHHPEVGFIGCEVFINGVASLLRYVEEQSLSNIRVHNDDARTLLEAIPDASISRLYLLHPDPWPKFRHAARRFVQPGTIRRLAQLMSAQGEFRIATDHPVYLGWTLRIMADQPWFDWTASTARDWLDRPVDWPQTRYEAKAIREGRRCTYLRYRRNVHPAR